VAFFFVNCCVVRDLKAAAAKPLSVFDFDLGRFDQGIGLAKIAAHKLQGFGGTQLHHL
jgi:hypothetical protein